MDEQPLEVQVEYILDSIVRSFDELCVLAAKPETARAVEANKLAIGQAVTRGQLILSFLEAWETPKLKVVR